MKFNKITLAIRYLLLTCVFVTGLISIIATGGGGSGSVGIVDGDDGTGTLSIRMTDKVTDDFQAVYVTIQEVSVHTSVDEQNAGEEQENGENEGEETGSWEVIGEPKETYNLLDLVNGVLKTLGVGELEAGHYTQIRLLLGEENDGGDNILNEQHPEEYANYVVTNSGEYKELKVASGYQTGIKLNHGIDIESGVITELVLDFDAEKSIMKIGNGEYKLKPTIKVIDAEVSSTISGIVTDDAEEDPNPIEGALVTAQVYGDSEDEVLIQASTTTDENGEYRLILDEETYNIVVYKNGYSPECTNIELQPATDMTSEDFILTSVDTTGTIEGSVTITDGVTDQIVDISIRQSGECGVIEIASENNLASGAEYSITLPEGDYSLVASTTVNDETETQTYEFTIDSGSTLDPLDLNF